MADLSDLLTVLVCTSPTASDPSTDTIDRTLASVAGFDEIAHCPVLIGADGVRPEQRAIQAEYETKLWRLHTDGYDLRELGSWGHQANVMRLLLAHVTTPLILCMEHDTPFTPDVPIDWNACAETVLSGELHSLRFLHESRVIPEHEHLHLGERVSGAGVPYIRTSQWSQRPHLADTGWYRNLIDTYFGSSSRCFIEDCMYGVVQYHWRTYGREGLEKFRLGIHSDRAPTMQRSLHLDGRGGDEKGGQVFAYPGDEVPEGAPFPTLLRTF